MKKFLCVLFVLSIFLCMTACKKEEAPPAKEEMPEIKFLQSIDEAQKHDGKTVTITGFMSLLSPINGSLFYLTNSPFHTCPFCEHDHATLSNTVAVKSSDVQFTTLPIKVTGKLVFGDFSDSYGYKYSYRIEDATIEVLESDMLQGTTKAYYAIAENDYLGDLYVLLDCIAQVAHYEEIGIKPEDFQEYGEIPFTRYNIIKSEVEKLNANNDYEDFISILDKAEQTRISINKDLQANNIEAYKGYIPVADELTSDFKKLVNKYKF